jgi:hypothetical protein
MKRRGLAPAKSMKAVHSLKAEGRLQQRTGAHCELSGLWENAAGTRKRILEGQPLPSDSGHPCHWTYIGFREPSIA